MMFKSGHCSSGLLALATRFPLNIIKQSLLQEVSSLLYSIYELVQLNVHRIEQKLWCLLSFCGCAFSLVGGVNIHTRRTSAKEQAEDTSNKVVQRQIEWECCTYILKMTPLFISGICISIPFIQRNRKLWLNLKERRSEKSGRVSIPLVQKLSQIFFALN